MKKISNLKLHEEFKLYENMWNEELEGNGVSGDAIKKIAIYKAVNIRPEQGPRRRYKQELKIPMSWSDLQKVLNKELLDLKKEIIEYSCVGSLYDESAYDLTDPDEAEEYAEAKKDLDDYFSLNWPEIRVLIDTAKPGAIINIFEVDYDDFDVAWEGTISYDIIIL
jgi:hypothetical protein